MFWHTRQWVTCRRLGHVWCKLTHPKSSVSRWGISPYKQHTDEPLNKWHPVLDLFLRTKIYGILNFFFKTQKKQKHPPSWLHSAHVALAPSENRCTWPVTQVMRFPLPTVFFHTPCDLLPTACIFKTATFPPSFEHFRALSASPTTAARYEHLSLDWCPCVEVVYISYQMPPIIVLGAGGYTLLFLNAVDVFDQESWIFALWISKFGNKHCSNQCTISIFLGQVEGSGFLFWNLYIQINKTPPN